MNISLFLVLHVHYSHVLSLVIFIIFLTCCSFITTLPLSVNEFDSLFHARLLGMMGLLTRFSSSISYSLFSPSPQVQLNFIPLPPRTTPSPSLDYHSIHIFSTFHSSISPSTSSFLFRDVYYY
jgi:hypothetical protein